MKIKILLFLISVILLCNCASAVDIPAAGGYTVTSGGVYDLTGNITAAATGLTINADNVIIRGHGYTVFYENSAWGYGLRSTNRSNITAQDIDFVCVNGSYTDGSAFYITGVNGINIRNCTGNTTAGQGIYIINSQNINVINSTGITNASAGSGISLLNNNKLNITNSSGLFTNTALTNGYGVAVQNTSGLVISNVTGSHTRNVGTYIYDSDLISVDRLTGISQNNTGLYFYECNNGTIANSIGSSYSGKGVRVIGNYNTLSNCTISSVSDNGLFFSSAVNNSVSRCTVSSTTVPAVWFETSALNNTFSQMTVFSPYGSTPHSEKHILGMGDSITYLGHGNYINNTLNAVNPTWHYSNRGISGETSVDGLKRFESEIEIYGPQYVAIMYGTNDIDGSIPQSTTVNTIIQMADIATAHNVTPYILLVTPSDGDNTSKLALNAALLSAANENEYQVIDTWDALDTTPNNGIDEEWNTLYFQDGDHPNDAGALSLGTLIANKMMISAEFVSPSYSYTAGQLTKFYDRSPYATSWYWDFDNDGVIDSTSKNPVKTYGEAGTYSVKLISRNSYGNHTATKTDLITVSSAQAISPLEKFLWWLKIRLGM